MKKMEEKCEKEKKDIKIIMKQLIMNTLNGEMIHLNNIVTH